MNDSGIKFEFLFGGTFDPVHFGHLGVIEALHYLAADIPIRLLPCAIPALKTLPQTTFQQRVDMLLLAISSVSSIVKEQVMVDSREQQREQPSYTIDTLDSLRQDCPDKRFIFVMGMDSFYHLKLWHDWKKLNQNCHLLVVNRPGVTVESVELLCMSYGFSLNAHFKSMIVNEFGGCFLLTMPNKYQSSSQIRQLVENKLVENKLVLDAMLPQSVIEYIHHHHLYKSE